MKQRNNTTLQRVGVYATAAVMSLAGYANLVLADEKTDIQQVRSGISKLMPGTEPDSVIPSVIPGIYEVMIGPQLYYVSSEGKYLLSGKLFDIASREDLTTPKVTTAKAKAIEGLGEENMVIFSPQEVKHTVTVFTDIDCGYCRKLHNEIDQYNDLGIRVRYLSFPRAGVGSESNKKAVSVWCADDPKKAMTLAKAGKEVEQKECENPVKAEMELGQVLGVTGTPALFFADGEMLPGYVPAKRLSAYLKQKTGR